MARTLPHEAAERFLQYAGTGTDLIFNRGIDLPGFASFPLLEAQHTRDVLAAQMLELTEVARSGGFRAIIDTPTWMANRDRAGALGYDAGGLADVNRDAIALMDSVRGEAGHPEALVSVCIGPRADPYSDTAAMTVEQARAYHGEQLGAIAGTAADLATAYTFNRVPEAAGCALAARDHGVPLALSFVVETDGCLSDGTALADAVSQVEDQTAGAPIYYLANCAHPSHFVSGLPDTPRFKGVIVNASRCSHAELDEATELDDGDPDALGSDVAALVRANAAINVVGGCCGTDMRHLRRMMREVSKLEVSAP